MEMGISQFWTLVCKLEPFAEHLNPADLQSKLTSLGFLILTLQITNTDFCYEIKDWKDAREID